MRRSILIGWGVLFVSTVSLVFFILAPAVDCEYKELSRVEDAAHAWHAVLTEQICNDHVFTTTRVATVALQNALSGQPKASEKVLIIDLGGDEVAVHVFWSDSKTLKIRIPANSLISYEAQSYDGIDVQVVRE